MQRERMKKRIFLVSILTAALSGTAVAQEAVADSTEKRSVVEKTIDLAEDILDLVTVEREKWSSATYPAASYSGRTGLAVGVMHALQLHAKSDKRPTTITPAILISTKGMFEIQADAEIYPTQTTYIQTKAEFFYLPDKYYGVGNDDKETLTEYDLYKYSVNTVAYKEVVPKLSIGVNMDINYYKFKKYDPQYSEAFDNGWENGLGLAVQLDTRNDNIYPHSGWLATVQATGYAKAFGGNSNYGQITLDARRYVWLGGQRVLAMQAYWSGIAGNAPFVRLPSCGGTRLGRAIPHSLKYVDDYAWLTQAEYRCPVYWRIGATAFAAAGNVYHTWGSEITDNMHLMVGGGLRFKILPKQNLNLRLDAGISSRGEHAIYLNIKEAF